MHRLSYLLLLLCAAPALARPFYGSHSCLTCHFGGQFNDPGATLLDTEGFADPVERPDALNDHGGLPYYTVRAGETVQLKVQIANLPAGTRYDVVITNGYDTLGTQVGDVLNYTFDPTWAEWSDFDLTAFWFTAAPSSPHIPFEYSTPQTYAFNLTVDPTTTPDFYEFVMGWSGAMGTDAGMQRFFVEVTEAPEPGTMMLGAAAIALLARRGRRMLARH